MNDTIRRMKARNLEVRTAFEQLPELTATCISDSRTDTVVTLQHIVDGERFDDTTIVHAYIARDSHHPSHVVDGWVTFDHNGRTEHLDGRGRAEMLVRAARELGARKVRELDDGRTITFTNWREAK